MTLLFIYIRETVQRILIRVDASPEIALGHLKRCISLAEGLITKGVEPLFLCLDDESSRKLLSGFSFQTAFIDTPINTGDDIVSTLNLMKEKDLDCVILDSYSVNSDYLDHFSAVGRRVICIDDIADRPLPCSMIINGGLRAEELNYEAPLKLLGIKYCLLSKPFWNPSATKTSGDINNIMITMGGIDHYRFSERCMKIIDKIPGAIRITIIIGPFYDNKLDIEKVARQISKEVELVTGKNDLHPYMQKCDMAISAGGFTLYELATLRKPVIGLGLWENQYRNVDELDKMGAILGLRYIDDNKFHNSFESAVCRMADSPELRCDLAEKAGALFDGQGTLRIASEIKKFIELNDIRET